MNILILGAGRVGEQVAESLLSEQNAITVIDTDPVRLRELQERYDLRGVLGNGTDPQVLAEAGAADAELLLACAARDETNLVCCKLAHLLFRVPTRVARVHAQGLTADPRVLGPEGFAVDRLICPESSVSSYIQRLIDYPEALQVRDFVGGRAALVSVRAVAGAPLVGRRIAELGQTIEDLPMRIVAIYRRLSDEPDRFVPCRGDTQIQAGDEVFVLAATAQVPGVLAALHRPAGQASHPVRRVMIAGGSVFGERLAMELGQNRPDLVTKLIEPDAQRGQDLACRLPGRVLVLHGEATDEDLLSEEDIESVDLFAAVSDDDENNIMACLLAKRLGARRVLALIHRRSYAELMHGTQIDIALSPAQAVLGELLMHVRRGDVLVVHSLRRGVAEALEIVVRGDKRHSRVTGRRMADLRLPEGVHMGLIARGLPDSATAPLQQAPAEPEVIIPHSHTVLEQGDHIVFFLPHKRLVRDVEQLFRVGSTFF